MKKFFCNLVFVFSVLIISISCKLESINALYEVTYVSDHGDIPQSIKVTEGTVLAGTQLPDLVAENYDFEGWYTGEYADSSSIISGGEFVVTEDVTLTAKWKGNKCIITYKPKEGSDEDCYTEYYEFGQTFEIKENPYTIPDGYVFKGWEIEETVYQPGNEVQAVGQNMDFTAVIQNKNDNPYSIVYKNVLNTDTVVLGTNPTVFNDGDKIVIYDLQRTGYVFEGWYTDEALTNKAVTMWKPTKAPLAQDSTSLVLYAKWTPVRYTVIFNANGGDGSSEPLECYYDQSYSVPECPFGLSGFKFLKWSTTKSPESYTVSYLPRTDFKNLSVKNNDIVTLYATWKDLSIPSAPSSVELWEFEWNSITLKINTTSDSDYVGTRIYVYKGEEIKDEAYVKTEELSSKKYPANSTVYYRIENLERNTRYSFKITSIDVYGNETGDAAETPELQRDPVQKKYASNFKSQTLNDRPVEISNLQINESGEKLTGLQWTNPDSSYGFAGLRIYVNGEFKQSVPKSTSMSFGSALDYSIGTEYTIKVTTYRNTGSPSGDIGESQGVTIQCGKKPYPITNPSINRYPTSIGVTFTKPEGNVTGIQLEATPVNQNNEPIGTTVTKYFPYDESKLESGNVLRNNNIPGLTVNTKYLVKAITKTGNLLSDPVEVGVVSTTALPSGKVDIGYIVYKNADGQMFAYCDLHPELEVFGVIIAKDSNNMPLRMINTWDWGEKTFSRMYNASYYNQGIYYCKEEGGLTGKLIETSFDDGEGNMKVEDPVKWIEKVGGEKYNSADHYGVTTDDFDDGWYIPAINEFNILTDTAFVTKINEVLSSVGKSRIENYKYFSSTLTGTEKVYVWNNNTKQHEQIYRFASNYTNANKEVYRGWDQEHYLQKAHFRLFMNVSNKGLVTEHADTLNE